MKLTNPWVGYIDRSFEQMMTSIMARMATYVPEITDRSDSNPWIKAARIWSGIGEMLGFYTDNNARESFLPTARRYASAVKFAALVDYRIRGVLPATADLVFSIATPEAVATTIPAGTIVRTTGGIAFQTLQAGSIAAGQTTTTIAARNWQKVTGAIIGSSTGAAGQRFPLVAGVVDNNITLTVGSGSVAWTPVDTFAYATSTSTSFRASANQDQVLEIGFGDGMSGQIPGAGQSITATYYTSNGANGNVAAGTLTELSGLLSPGGQTLRVRNPQRASGGTDVEGLEELRKRIPLSLRTLDRAVTYQDYIDIGLLAPGVAQAGVSYNCGKTVTVYVAPVGGGVASTALLGGVEAYFEPRRMITTRVKALAAGEVHVLLTAYLEVKANYYRAATVAAAKASLLDFLSVSRQEINGSLEIGDLYEILENTEGVDFSRITLLTAQPYARPIGHLRPLNWTVDVQPDSRTTITWRVTLQPNGDFELARGTTYVKRFRPGVLQVFNEVEFTINAGNYVTGDSWQFVTYPYNDSIYLNEQSVLIANAADITLTADGGIV